MLPVEAAPVEPPDGATLPVEPPDGALLPDDPQPEEWTTTLLPDDPQPEPLGATDPLDPQPLPVLTLEPDEPSPAGAELPVEPPPLKPLNTPQPASAVSGSARRMTKHDTYFSSCLFIVVVFPFLFFVTNGCAGNLPGSSCGRFCLARLKVKGCADSSTTPIRGCSYQSVCGELPASWAVRTFGENEENDSIPRLRSFSVLQQLQHRQWQVVGLDSGKVADDKRWRMKKGRADARPCRDF